MSLCTAFHEKVYLSSFENGHRNLKHISKYEVFNKDCYQGEDERCYGIQKEKSPYMMIDP